MKRSAALRQVNNPHHPFIHDYLEWEVEPPEIHTEVYVDATRSILSKNDSPDLSFQYSVNPYRGCYHGCAYCYARPSHHYLDFGAGTDFERKLVVKENAPALLRKALRKKSWKGEVILFSGNTDCYQALEAQYGLTRACLQECLEVRNPVYIVTKSSIIERDIDLLRELSLRAHCTVIISLPFLDRDNARAIEPYVPTPQRRLKTIKRLADAGISVGVNVAPIIPGLNDEEAPKVLEAAKAAGAGFFNYIMLRLPPPVDEVFEKRVRAQLPLRADRIMNQIRASRGGSLYNSGFGQRMRGQGERWKVFESMLLQAGRRLGFGNAPALPEPSPYQRPPAEAVKNSQKEITESKQLKMF